MDNNDKRKAPTTLPTIRKEETNSMVHVLRKTVAITSLTLAVNGLAHAEVWDLPSPQPSDNYITENVGWFADQVREATDGELDIRVHPSGSLFPGDQIKRAVQRDQAQIGVHVLSAHQNENILYGIDSVPFLADSFEESAQLWEVTKPALDEMMAEQNLQLLYHIPWPPQGIFFDREIESPEDTEGLKFRAYNTATARFAELMGMTPTLIEEAELSQAAATGMVQSLISSGDPVYNHQLWNYLPHFYDAKAWLVLSHVFVNKDRWEALDEETRQEVLTIAAEAEQRGGEQARELTDELKNRLSDKGVAINQPNEELQAAFNRIGEAMQEEWLEKAGPQGQQLVEEYRAMQ
ncbi:C4-dicarboxylate ABC transporter substrate-binding protein [Halomonas heilongjiangensis]|uniref:C4-dicarboxylate ABC transporter substrate-binding protein n=2 Tax=Halomonas heilongjiangensis TaxID=1387883 RepID=A0A2N7TU08_9GAMM|nr:C4-dicarboxylate ABC transporter substrate-binding protein [Halomonas heilongjiangensis]PXX87226.1 C4-dicarboxylate ABC transporter substrate-binding protein [Halomonas heilongjiangensis]